MSARSTALRTSPKIMNVVCVEQLAWSTRLCKMRGSHNLTGERSGVVSEQIAAQLC